MLRARSLIAVAALAFATLGGASAALAFEHARSEYGARLSFPPGPISFSIAPGFGDDERAAIHRAFATWSAVPCARLSFVPAVGSANAITVTRAPLPAEHGTLAAWTVVKSDRPRAGIITSAAIVLDDARSRPLDLESLVLHELGHALGLAHSRVRTAVMAAGVKPGDVQRALHDDDIQGACALRPR